MKKRYQIEVSCDNDDAEDFVDWLMEQGHTAIVGHTTGNYINGVHTSIDLEAHQISTALWNAFCNA